VILYVFFTKIRLPFCRGGLNVWELSYTV